MLSAGVANATIVQIIPTTAAMDFWFSEGTRGGAFSALYENGAGPGYACSGLGGYGYMVPVTCTAVPTPEVWGGSAVYSGSFNDDLSMLNLSWTGMSGVAVDIPQFELFVSSVSTGTLNAAGVMTGDFACWNNPVASSTFYGADFCGNGTGKFLPPPPTTAAPTDISSKQLQNFVSVTPTGGGGVRILMNSTAYTDCVNDAACAPDAETDLLVQWNVQTVPVPAAVWLFGSALGLLGWMRRKVA